MMAEWVRIGTYGAPGVGVPVWGTANRRLPGETRNLFLRIWGYDRSHSHNRVEYSLYDVQSGYPTSLNLRSAEEVLDS